MDMIFQGWSMSVPSVAAVVDDIVEGFENSVRQPVLPHELPDIRGLQEQPCFAKAVARAAMSSSSTHTT
jgi:hypothetical protein